MPLILQKFPDDPSIKEFMGTIEKTSEHILTIHDATAYGFLDLTTEIDLNCSLITQTRKFFCFTWRRVYPLYDLWKIEIQDKGRLMEGYQLPLFLVRLVGKESRLRIYLTDDLNDATIVRNILADFLDVAKVSTHRQQ